MHQGSSSTETGFESIAAIWALCSLELQCLSLYQWTSIFDSQSRLAMSSKTTYLEYSSSRCTTFCNNRSLDWQLARACCKRFSVFMRSLSGITLAVVPFIRVTRCVICTDSFQTLWNLVGYCTRFQLCFSYSPNTIRTPLSPYCVRPGLSVFRLSDSRAIQSASVPLIVYRFRSQLERLIWMPC